MLSFPWLWGKQTDFQKPHKKPKQKTPNNKNHFALNLREKVSSHHRHHTSVIAKFHCSFSLHWAWRSSNHDFSSSPLCRFSYLKGVFICIQAKIYKSMNLTEQALTKSPKECILPFNDAFSIWSEQTAMPTKLFPSIAPSPDRYSPQHLCFNECSVLAQEYGKALLWFRTDRFHRKGVERDCHGMHTALWLSSAQGSKIQEWDWDGGN